MYCSLSQTLDPKNLSPDVFQRSSANPACAFQNRLQQTQRAISRSSRVEKDLDRIAVIQSPKLKWRYGEGATDREDRHLQHEHVEINPFEEGRPVFYNYSLLISGVVPQPIGFISTLSGDGKPNLALFSYFQVVGHDPPVFVVGFSGRATRPKDTLTNIQATGECTINVVSEHMAEAVNACSLDAPVDVSEWTLSGLIPAASTTVWPSRVRESIFSIKGKLCEVVDYKTSRSPDGPHGRLAIIEGVRFWVREDAIDAQRRDIDLNVLRPVSQLGGISYARMTETFELARSNWSSAMKMYGPDLERLLISADGTT